MVRLEEIANKVRLPGADRKWEELSELLQKNNEMFDQQGQHRKLIIFSEHKDTINYLIGKISALIGRPEAPIYIKRPFGKEPDFAVTSVNYNLKELIARGEVMSCVKRKKPQPNSQKPKFSPVICTGKSRILFIKQGKML